MSDTFLKLEVITGVARRRRFSTELKLAVVAETMQPGMSVSYVARRHGLSPSVVFRWRQLLVDEPHGPAGGSSPALRPLLNQIDLWALGAEFARRSPDWKVRLGAACFVQVGPAHRSSRLVINDDRRRTPKTRTIPGPSLICRSCGAIGRRRPAYAPGVRAALGRLKLGPAEACPPVRLTISLDRYRCQK